MKASLPLLVERTAKGDVFLQRGVEQPGLLGGVGHGVSVFAASRESEIRTMSLRNTSLQGAGILI